MFKKISLVIIVFLLSSNSTIASSFPSIPREKKNEIYDFSPTLKSAISSEFYLGKFKVVMEKTTLKQIISALGVGRVQSEDYSGWTENFVCYDGTFWKKKFRVWITEGGIGAREVEFLYVKEIREGKKNKQSVCPALPIAFSKISVKGETWLGLTKEKAQAVIGKPSAIKGSWLRYLYDENLPKDGSLTSSFDLHFSNGHIDMYKFSQLTTY